MNRRNSDRLSDVLREARVAEGISMRELARRLEIAPSYLSDIENDRRVPSESVLRGLSQQLSIEFDELMARAGRFGERTERYLRRTPAAGALLRRISEANLGDAELERLLEATDQLKKRD